VHKDSRPLGRARGPGTIASWRLRALQFGVAIFTTLLLVSLIGVVVR
jgi:hypothetical protein